MQVRAERLLRQMYGDNASFREGQWEAIKAVLEEHQRILVVQRTGWGKSLIYFLVTKLLREAGAGPTILVSPLLSLMRNQILMANHLEIRSGTLNCTNVSEWEAIEAALSHDQFDILLISPERLANERFKTKVLPALTRGIGMLVVDEAHCISDWGHDFRPDYRRIVHLIRSLPKRTPVLATTATANDRVVNDIVYQLGSDLKIIRGPLVRNGLRLQVMEMGDQEQRLAWLAENLGKIPGTGIIYCLTIADCGQVASWLRKNHIDAHEYHARLLDDQRIALENSLLRNEIKALVATVALGMGFDKPDLGFVVHFQRPGSIVAYYQQVGRAGRSLENAFAILLAGTEDEEIHYHFIANSFPKHEVVAGILQELERSGNGMGISELSSKLNLSQSVTLDALKTLEIEGAIIKAESRYFRTLTPWTADHGHAQEVSQIRLRELLDMREFITSPHCLMQFITARLNDPYASKCDCCSNCQGDFLPRTTNPEYVEAAALFLRNLSHKISPRKRWPSGLGEARKGNIAEEIRCQEGRCLGSYGDSGWGKWVKKGKYTDGKFDLELARASAEMLRTQWNPDPFPEWVTAIPSRNYPSLVPNLARDIAAFLGLPFHQVLIKAADTPEQKTRNNSVLQCKNAMEGFAIADMPFSGPVLLIDDIVDSRWTFTICGALLRESGSGPVYPLAMVSACGGGDTE